MRPPSPLSMLAIPSAKNIERGIGLEGINVSTSVEEITSNTACIPPSPHAQAHAIEHDAFLTSCGASRLSLLYFALHNCCDTCVSRSIPLLSVKAQHDVHRAAVSQIRLEF